MKLLTWIMCVIVLMVGMQVSAAEQPIGTVSFVTGNAYLQSGSQKTTLSKGSNVFVGQTFATAPGSHLHLRMVDGGFLSLRPNSEVALRRYDADLKSPQAIAIQIDQHKGVVRWVTGKAGQANRTHFRFNSPVSGIGIRGTDFTVFTDSVSTSVSIREGIVVVAPFSDTCIRDALGPCSGEDAVTLADNTGNAFVAEVYGAQASLVREDKAFAVPDKVQPAHPSEDKSLQDSKLNVSTVTIPTNSDETVSSNSNNTKSTNNTSTDSTTSTTKTDASASTATNSSNAATTSNSTATSSGTTNTASVDNSASSQTASGSSSNASGSSTSAEVSSNSSAASSTTVENSATTVSTSESTTTTSTAEVASVTPVTEEVGSKDSVTSELASQILAQATATESTKTLEDAAVQTTDSNTTDTGTTQTDEQVFSTKTRAATTPTGSAVVAENDEYAVVSTESTDTVSTRQASSVDFKLDDSVAGVKTATGLQNAQVVNGNLNINFDTNAFNTQLEVASAALTDGNATLNAQGTLGTAGDTFASDAANSNMTVNGVVSADGSNAGYVFEQDTTGIIGATTWQQP